MATGLAASTIFRKEGSVELLSLSFLLPFGIVHPETPTMAAGPVADWSVRDLSLTFSGSGDGENNNCFSVIKTKSALPAVPSGPNLPDTCSMKVNRTIYPPVCRRTNSRALRGSLAAMLGLLLLFVTDSAKAQVSASSPATISLSILPAVSITSSAGSDGAGDLNFGPTIVNTTASINPNTSSSASLFTISAGVGMPMMASFSSPTVALKDSLGNTLSFNLQAVGAQVSSSQLTATSLMSGGAITMSSSGLYYVWIGGTDAVPSTAAGLQEDIPGERVILIRNQWTAVIR